MWSTPIQVKEYLRLPLKSPQLVPPREPGIYAAGLQYWNGESQGGQRILSIGVTTKGKDPHLLYRVSQLVLKALGFTDSLVSKIPYYHPGGRNIWRYCTDPQCSGRKANDPFGPRRPFRRRICCLVRQDQSTRRLRRLRRSSTLQLANR
jgi:hypothetical protein